jgi:hypothetical protein
MNSEFVQFLTLGKRVGHILFGSFGTTKEMLVTRVHLYQAEHWALTPINKGQWPDEDYMNDLTLPTHGVRSLVRRLMNRRSH